jgi:4-alpha-glucanotransferase
VERLPGSSVSGAKDGLERTQARSTDTMRFDRSAGILAHPTSFPGAHGIGDLGHHAYQFIDWLVTANQRIWQVLPLGPTGFGNSPYASPSAFAGNPLFISLDFLRDQGLLQDNRITPAWPFPEHDVNFDAVIPFKTEALWDAFDASLQPDSGFDHDLLSRFVQEESTWLDDYALFMAIKDHFGGGHWLDWPLEVRVRRPAALAGLRAQLIRHVEFHTFVQFVFRQQWFDLKRYANERGIRIVGDVPIYVASDSADVWANQQEFRLDAEGSPTVVSGVPPDLFTEHGQLWGNPIFNWRHMAGNQFAWWRRRIEEIRKLVDIIRIDHFRGFAAGWVVPATDQTARTGHWEAGPGRAIFDAIEEDLGELPIVVEDLGLITPDVHALRQELQLPGMKVLQFAFDGNSRSQYLPHMYDPNCVVYPGTHDNQTTVGWFQSISDESRRQVQTYLGTDGSDIAWDLARLALASVADMAIVTLQDIMRLGDEARMNTPGVAVGNWRWRYMEHQLHGGLAAGLGEITHSYGRTPVVPQSFEPDPFDYSAPGTEHGLAGAIDS